MLVTSFPSGGVPVLGMVTDQAGETVSPQEILTPATPYKSSGVRIELSGHFKLTANLEFDGFLNLQLAGIGQAIIEQQHPFNDASPLTLRNCAAVRVADLRLLGSGTPRSVWPLSRTVRASSAAGMCGLRDVSSDHVPVTVRSTTELTFPTVLIGSGFAETTSIEPPHPV